MDKLFNDEYYMQMALKQAEKARENNEVPIGAVIVLNNQVIGKAHNQVEMLHDATAHAEILAITQAAEFLNNWRLNDAVLYVTKEPCIMCAGALVNSRIKKVLFGAKDNKFGGCGGLFNIHNCPESLHKFKIEAGLMEYECSFILQNFFRKKRIKIK